jgi:hypothetical protein
VVTTFFMGQAIPEFWLINPDLDFYVWLKNPVTGDPYYLLESMYTLGIDFSIETAKIEFARRHGGG